MKRLFNIAGMEEEYRDFGSRAGFLQMLEGFDGIELSYYAQDKEQIIPKEKVIGFHMSSFFSWLDFWNGGVDACLEDFETRENAISYYGGTTREAILKRFRTDLERAEQYQAEYVVFHVADCSIAESYSGHYRHRSEEVIDRTCDLLNELFPKTGGRVKLLLENLWHPGLTFTDPALTGRLLEGIHYPNKGLMLDTGHLIHTNPRLQSEEEAILYIQEMLELQETYGAYIKGIHLNQSQSGAYILQMQQNPPPGAQGYEARMEQMFLHILQIDQHLPFTSTKVRGLLERIAPEYVTFEFISRSHEEKQNMLNQQRKALGWLTD